MPTKFVSGLGTISSGLTPPVGSGGPSPLSTDVPVSTGIAVPVSVVTSQPSDLMPYSTLFEDFDLSVEPSYRFFEKGERDTPSQVTDPESAPRLIRLEWRPAVRQTVTIHGKRTKSTEDRSPRSFDRGGITFGSLPVMDFSSAVGSLANGYFAPGVLHTSVEPTTPVFSRGKRFDEFSFLAGGDTRTNDALSLASEPVRPMAEDVRDAGRRAKVSFVNPAIDGAFSEARAQTIGTSQAANAAVALSKIATNLQVIGVRPKGGKGVPPPSFPSVPELIGVQYMGYLIERYRIDTDGVQTLDATIHIDDPSVSSFVDLDVLFEVQYTYRMRSVVRWTRDRGMGFDSNPQVLPVRTGMSPPLASHVSSFYAGDWSRWSDARVVDDIVPDPPDNIFVRPVSPKGEVHIAWTEPFDPQRDLSEIVLVRRTVGLDGKFTSPWQELSRFDVGNGLYIDRDVQTQEERPGRYVYALYTVSIHDQVSALSEQVGVALTRRWRYSGELPLVQVSSPGASLDASGDTSVVPFLRKDISLSPRSNVRFTCRSGPGPSPVLDKRYVLLVRSLSTGEETSVDLNLDAYDVVRRIALR